MDAQRDQPSSPAARGEQAGLDDELTDALVRTRRFFTRGGVSPDLITRESQQTDYPSPGPDRARRYKAARGKGRDPPLGSQAPRRGWERVQ